MTMLRDINQAANGRLDSTDPRVGVRADEISLGFANPSFLLNDIDADFPDRLYSLEIIDLPTAGELFIDKWGAGSFKDAPVGLYTGDQRVKKYDLGVGLVAQGVGSYSIAVTEEAPPLVTTVTSVVVTPAGVVLAGGSTQKFDALALGENNPPQEFIWVTTLGAVDVNGELTAPAASEDDQVGAVIAISKFDSTKRGMTTFAVPGGGSNPDVDPQEGALILLPANLLLSGRGTVQMAAYAEGQSTAMQGIVWETDLGFVDENGLLTAPDAIMQRQHGTVRGTDMTDADSTGTTSFTVMALGEGFVPSAARTVRILAGRQVYDTGPFWTVNGTLGPVGSKDPNSTIDIPFDWSAWLADIGNPALSAIDFLLSPGLVSTGAVAMRNDDKLIGAAVLVSEGSIGGGNNSGVHTITCRITTATEPARIEDRTVVLQIREQ